MSRKLDPRPARTRALLFDGLLELIQKKRWERIRVQDILDRTGVGRSTFYAHFDSKFDLLTSGIPTFTLPIADSDGEPDLLPLFTHVEEMRPILLPLMSQPLLGEIMDEFHRKLASSWAAHLSTIDIAEERRPVVAEMLAGGLLAVARGWMADGCQPEPAEIASDFSRYVAVVIGEAG